jgi:putative ABC transport system permease protein
MNLVGLSASYIRARRLGAVLNLLLLGLGIGTIVLLLLAIDQIEEKLSRDAKGIDLVVGAKGSPLQLILSSIYHVDIPTGNIPLAEADRIREHKLVQSTIPLALGDSFHGFRIVGTSIDYPRQYGAELSAGTLWNGTMEVTLGAGVAASSGLGLGATFNGSHGLVAGGEEHTESAYRVVGILRPTGTALDNLVLTAIESVWAVHEHHHDDEPAEAAGDEGEASREITALLVRYRSPVAAALLPRLVNSRSSLQAASPAFETARLLKLLGIGADTLRAFAGILILSAGLSIFIALYNALDERRFDLALMRSLGASRAMLFLSMLCEALLLTTGGCALGLLLGHAAATLMGRWVSTAHTWGLNGLRLAPGEVWVVPLALAVGTIAALLPAIAAYRTDIARTLARG